MNGATQWKKYARGASFKALTFGDNSIFDVLIILLGGLPFYLPVLLVIGEHFLHKNRLFDWYFLANQFVSMPHIWATYFRLSRKIKEGKVNFLLGLPAYLSVVALLITATLQGFFLQAMTIVNVWQSYHYLRQTYGVGRFFARSENETAHDRKLVFLAYHLAMPVFILGRWNMLFIYWKGKPSDSIIPIGFPTSVLIFLAALAALGLAIGLFSEAKKYRTSLKIYDCSGILNLLVYYAIHWFGFLSIQNYLTGFLAVTIFHAIQYMGITFRLEERQQTTPLVSKVMKMVPTICSFGLFWIILYMVGDATQQYVFPVGNQFMPQFALICLSSISAHHYLVDTVLWNRKTGL